MGKVRVWGEGEGVWGILRNRGEGRFGGMGSGGRRGKE